MNGIVTTGLVTWLTSLHPQVEAAVIAAVATATGILGTTVVGLAGFRHARRVAEASLDGQRQRSIDERRFAVYEDAVKYLLRLTLIRLEYYAFWPEASESSNGPEASSQGNEVPMEEHMDLSARIETWASDDIRSLWKLMGEADDQVDVGRMHLRFRRGQTEFVPAEPFSAEDIKRAKNLINDSTQVANQRRHAVIEAIRAELVGAKPLK